MFMVGVAMPFSYASRQAAGAVVSAACFGHALVRSLVLIALGIFLRLDGRARRPTSRS